MLCIDHLTREWIVSDEDCEGHIRMRLLSPVLRSKKANKEEVVIVSNLVIMITMKMLVVR